LFKRQTESRAVIQRVAVGHGTPPSRQVKDPFEELYSLGRAIEPPYDPESLAELAELNEVHAAALDAVAADAVGRGWTFVPRVSNPDEQARTEVELFLEHVNPNYTFSELLYQAVWELRAIGWSAWEVVRADDGSIGAIYPLPAHTLRLTRDPNIFVQHRGGAFRYFKLFGAPSSWTAEPDRWSTTPMIQRARSSCSAATTVGRATVSRAGWRASRRSSSTTRSGITAWPFSTRPVQSAGSCTCQHQHR
jgi:hypothetical protein